MRGAIGLLVAAICSAACELEDPQHPGPRADASTFNGDDSFATADPLDGSVSGAIDHPFDIDYFWFDGEEGSWMEVDALPTGAQFFLPLVTIFDDAHKQIAEGFFITTHLAYSGRYYLRVEDYAGTGGGPDYQYQLQLIHLANGEDGVEIAVEQGDDAASARPFSVGGVPKTLCGLYDHASDVDVWWFTLDQSSPIGFRASADFGGPGGNGSTSEFASLRITDSTGTDTIARVTRQSWELVPILESGSYLLWIEAEPGELRGNDFYVMAASGGWIERIEHELVPGENDTIAAAEASGEVIDSDPGASYDFFYVHLPEGDVDHIGIDLPAATFSAVCQSRAIGSGVFDLAVELRDAAGTLLTMAVEDDLGAFLDDVAVTAGRYWIRLSRGAQDPGVSGTYASCFYMW